MSERPIRGASEKPDRFDAPDPGWTFVSAVFVLSRLFFLGVGAAAVALLPRAEPAGDLLEPSGFLSYWAHWDGAWYSEIATYGYELPEDTAFFPLFPMLVRAGVTVGGGPAFWGVLVSLVATAFAMYFLYRIAEDLMGKEAAMAATLAFAFFPTAFFLNAAYSEALFVAFAAGSYWAARVRRELLLAGLLGALAAATRNFGVLLLIPLGYEWLRNRQEFGWGGILRLGLVPVGLLGYIVFLWHRFGDPFISFRQQEDYWGRELANPFSTMQEAWITAAEGLKYLLDPATLFLDRAPFPSLDASNTVSLAFLILFLIVMILGVDVLPPGLSAYALLVTLLPILTPSPLFPLMSLPRFMLGAFPIFLILGYLLSRSKPALYLWLFASGSLGAALTALFVTWRWVA